MRIFTERTEKEKEGSGRKNYLEGEVRFLLSTKAKPGSDIDQIRKIGFEVTDGATTLIDEFDKEKTAAHLRVMINGELAVYHRYTSNCIGSLASDSWGDFKAPLPRDKKIMELGRFVINKPFRKLFGLFEYVVLAGIAFAKIHGFDFASTMIRDNRNLVCRCEALGFKAENIVIESKVPHHAIEKDRLLTYDLNDSQIFKKLEEAEAKFKEANKDLLLQIPFLKFIEQQREVMKYFAASEVNPRCTLRSSL